MKLFKTRKLILIITSYYKGAFRLQISFSCSKHFSTWCLLTKCIYEPKFEAWAPLAVMSLWTIRFRFSLHEISNHFGIVDAERCYNNTSALYLFAACWRFFFARYKFIFFVELLKWNYWSFFNRQLSNEQNNEIQMKKVKIIRS